MSLQTALVAIKTANATLNSLIGVRFYPDEFPEAIVFPAVKFWVVGRVPKDDTFNTNPTFTEARVQMDGVADSSVNRSALRSALLGCFLGHSSTQGGKRVQWIRLARESESKEMLNTNIAAYRITIDFMVPFDE
jgi:hypothetical protein